MMRLRLLTTCALLLLFCLSARSAEFEPAAPILADGKPIDVEHMGHAAPFVGDFDGDGRKDLLVGEFYEGRLRIYRNKGTNRAPKFGRFTVFQDGAPSGCIWAS